MSKSSLGGQYDLLAAASDFVSLATLMGATGMWKGELSLDGTTAATVYLRFSNNPSDGSADVQIVAGTIYNHAFSAVNLSTIYVKGTSGDKVTLVGEMVQEDPRRVTVY